MTGTVVDVIKMLKTEVPFTCVTCQVLFKAADLQRAHYKTDWHRYNLKRKIAEFPPVTAEEFQFRVSVVKQGNEHLSKTNDCVYCIACKKSFNSPKTFENHLNSKKHVVSLSRVEINSDIAVPSNKPEKVVKPLKIVDDAESDSDTEEIGDEEFEAVVSDNNPIIHNNCLFCSNHSASFTKNVKHMGVSHSFFIPDLEYLADLRGLLLYLGEKVCQGFLCIWCNDRTNSFINMESAQRHMVDKGHTKILYNPETFFEYMDFYHYNDDASSSGDENDWESVTSESTACNTVPSLGEDVSMVLPSGSVIGHRSLARYYRQNLKPSTAIVCADKRVNKVLTLYNKLGWLSGSGKETKTRVRDIKYMSYVQKKQFMKLGIKANKLQTHFRQQVNF